MADRRGRRGRPAARRAAPRCSRRPCSTAPPRGEVAAGVRDLAGRARHAAEPRRGRRADRRRTPRAPACSHGAGLALAPRSGRGSPHERRSTSSCGPARTPTPSRCSRSAGPVQGVPGVAAGPGRDGHRRSTSRCSTGWASRCPTATTANDLVVAVRLEDDADAGHARRGRGSTVADALRAPARPRADRGGAAAHHGARALRRDARRARPGLGARRQRARRGDGRPRAPARDVMVFSDNVPVEQEVALKRTAADARPARDGPRLRHRGRRRRSGWASRTSSRPGRSASSPPPAPAASSCSRCSTTPASASRTRSASAGATCPPRSAGCPPARRCAASTPTRRSS